MPYKDPVKAKESSRERSLKYYNANKDKCNEKTKEWREKNKDKIKEKRKEEYENNKDNDEMKEENRIKSYNYYQLNKHTEEFIKRTKLSKWKHRGVLCDDWNILYDRYNNCSVCEDCGKENIKGRNKHLDHSHETGLFRNVVCCSCNTKRGK
tara:strand:- start:412 stop:867 length:456 start_codon:yes stop_codon:yes gene_type:complete